MSAATPATPTIKPSSGFESEFPLYTHLNRHNVCEATFKEYFLERYQLSQSTIARRCGKDGKPLVDEVNKFLQQTSTIYLSLSHAVGFDNQGVDEVVLKVMDSLHEMLIKARLVADFDERDRVQELIEAVSSGLHRLGIQYLQVWVDPFAEGESL